MELVSIATGDNPYIEKSIHIHTMFCFEQFVHVVQISVNILSLPLYLEL